MLSATVYLFINIHHWIYSSIRSWKRQLRLSIHCYFSYRNVRRIYNHSHFFFSPADAPVCISSSVTIVGASIDESVAIPCRISADPSKVSFEWTFSNSGERYEVPSGHYTTIQSSNVDVDHIYLDADENGTNGNGTLIPSVYHSNIHTVTRTHTFFQPSINHKH